jgi:RNA polymerase sigma factor (sigma-70 family)
VSQLAVTPAPDPPTVEGPEHEAASLFELYRERIREYCQGQLRDRQEAEDALQATFLYAFTLLQRGTKPRRPLPWLYTIAHNVCRTRRRALKRRKQVESGVDLETLHDSVGRDDPPREDVAALASSLATLPPGQREALLLREWQGLSYAEIAAQLGLSVSAVETVLFRARRRLARELRPVGERVASLVNGAVLLRMLRRFAPFGSSAKTSAAVLLAGTAAATTLLPLSDAPARPVVRPKPLSHLVRLQVAPRSAREVVPQPRPAPPAVPPHPAAEPTASAPAVTPAPAVPTTGAAASAVVDTTRRSRPATPAPAPSASANPAAPPLAPPPAPVKAIVSTAESAVNTATDTVTSTATSAASDAAAKADAITSEGRSVVQPAASTVQSTVSGTGAGSSLPLPPNIPLHSGA